MGYLTKQFHQELYILTCWVFGEADGRLFRLRVFYFFCMSSLCFALLCLALRCLALPCFALPCFALLCLASLDEQLPVDSMNKILPVYHMIQYCCSISNTWAGAVGPGGYGKMGPLIGPVARPEGSEREPPNTVASSTWLLFVSCCPPCASRLRALRVRPSMSTKVQCNVWVSVGLGVVRAANLRHHRERMNREGGHGARYHMAV